MAEVWPSSLPVQPLLGAAEELRDNTAKSSLALGPTKRRRRTWTIGGATEFRFILTEAQAQTFEAFYSTTLKDGVLPFTGLQDVLQLDVTFRIAGPPAIQEIAYNAYEVTVPLEIVRSPRTPGTLFADASVTAGQPTATGVGAVKIAGTASVAPSAPTVSSSGTIIKTGTASVTPSQPTVNAVGAVADVVGSATVTAGSPSVTATGERIITGSASVTPDQPTATGTGTAGEVTSVSFHASAQNSGSTSITIPATAQAGDVAVLFDLSDDSTTTPSGTPTGWTFWDTKAIGNFNVRVITSYKILEAGDPGASITGMSAGDEEQRKILAVFRPDAAATTITASSVSSSFDATATTKTALASGGTVPLIVIGAAWSDTRPSAQTDPTLTPAADGDIDNTTMNLLYKIYNSSPADVDLDKADDGIQYLGIGYLEVS